MNLHNWFCNLTSVRNLAYNLSDPVMRLADREKLDSISEQQKFRCVYFVEIISCTKVVTWQNVCANNIKGTVGW